MNDNSHDPVVFESRGKLHISWMPKDYVTMAPEAFKKLIALANGDTELCTCGQPRDKCPSGHWAGQGPIFDSPIKSYYIREYGTDWQQDRMDLGIFKAFEDAIAAVPIEMVDYDIIEVRLK